MELIFLPGGGIMMFIFMCLVLCGASIAAGFGAFAICHILKQWLFKVTPAGKKLQAGMGHEQRGFGEWPWYLTNKLPETAGWVVAILFFYTLLGPIMHACGLMKG